MNEDPAPEKRKPAQAGSPRRTGQSAAADKPGARTGKTRDRRTRGETSAKRSNGHPGVNGHDRASSPGAAHTAPAGKGSAASVDAGGTSAAMAASSSAAGLPRQASTDREACAEAAPAPSGRERSRQARPGGQAEAGPRPRVPGDANARVVAGKDSASSGAQKKVPPGEVPLPTDPAEFVEEIHRRIDLFQVWQALLECEDEKIKQRAVERLTDLRYKGTSALAEEPQQIVIDIDSAVARRAAEGARK